MRHLRNDAIGLAYFKWPPAMNRYTTACFANAFACPGVEFDGWISAGPTEGKMP